MHINSSQRNSCSLKERSFGGWGSFSTLLLLNSLQSSFYLLTLDTKNSRRLSTYITRAVLHSGLENRGYILKLNVSKRDREEFCIPHYQANFSSPLLLSVLWVEIWDSELRKQSLEARVLSDCIFNSWIWTRLFATKQIFVAGQLQGSQSFVVPVKCCGSIETFLTEMNHMAAMLSLPRPKKKKKNSH